MKAKALNYIVFVVFHYLNISSQLLGRFEPIKVPLVAQSDVLAY